jgi:hypothetical protein
MDNKIKISININKETIEAYIKNVRIAHIDFTIDDTQINVIDLIVDNSKTLQGYGYLMINLLKGIAQFYKKPIYLISYTDKILFYKKNDFISLFDLPKVISYDFFNMNKSKHTILYGQKKINIKNINPDKDISLQISNEDMIWIPSSLNEVDIYL